MFRLSFTKLRQTPLISTYVVLAIFVSATVMVLSELSHQRLAHVNQTLTTSLRMAALSNEVLLLTVDAETGERGFLLTEREEYLEPYGRPYRCCCRRSASWGNWRSRMPRSAIVSNTSIT